MKDAPWLPDGKHHWLEAEDCDGDAWYAVQFNVTEDYEDMLITIDWMMNPPAPLALRAVASGRYVVGE